MAIAIGVLDLTQSEDPTNDRQLIRAHAGHAGHTLAAIVEIDAETFMSTLYVLEQMHRHKACVIIAPSNEHVWTARRAYTEQAQVIVCDPYEIWQRGHKWPSLLPATPVGP